MLVGVPQRQRGSGTKGDWRVAPVTGGGGGWWGRAGGYQAGGGTAGGPREWPEPGGAHRPHRLGRPGRSPGSPGAAVRPCRGTSAQGFPRQGRRNASAALQTPELELPGSMVTRCPWRPEVPSPPPGAAPGLGGSLLPLLTAVPPGGQQGLSAPSAGDVETHWPQSIYYK